MPRPSLALRVDDAFPLDRYVDADLAIPNTINIVETALEHQRSFRPDAFGVETNQFQELLADDLHRVAEERGVLMPLYTLNNQVNKLVRIRRLTPYLSRRVVHRRLAGGAIQHPFQQSATAGG